MAQARAVLVQLGVGTYGLWRWWVSELAGLLPLSLRASSRRASILLNLTADGLVDEYVGADGTKKRFQPPIGLSDVAQDVAIPPRANLRVVLPTDCLHCVDLDLPSDALNSLEEAVRFQLALHAPLPLSEIIFSPSVIEKNRDAKTCKVSILMARRADCENIVEALGSCDFASLELSASRKNPRFVGFIPLTEMPKLNQRVALWKHPAALGGLAAILIIALFGITYVERKQAVAEQADIRQALAERTGVLIALDQNTQTLEAIMSALQTRSPVSQHHALLTDMTEAIPPPSFITNYRIDHVQVRLEGVSPNPQALAQTLQDMERFTTVTVQRVQRDTTDPSLNRFVIVADLEPGS